METWRLASRFVRALKLAEVKLLNLLFVKILVLLFTLKDYGPYSYAFLYFEATKYIFKVARVHVSTCTCSLVP